MEVLTKIIGAIVLVAVGAAGGWYAKGKYGTKIGAIVTAVSSPPKP